MWKNRQLHRGENYGRGSGYRAVCRFKDKEWGRTSDIRSVCIMTRCLRLSLTSINRSSVVEKVLLKAHEEGKNFSVYVVDSRPMLEGLFWCLLWNSLS